MRKKVEVRAYDNVPHLRFAIRGYEFRGGTYVNHGGGMVTYHQSWANRWYNFKVHCLALRYTITDKLGITKP